MDLMLDLETASTRNDAAVVAIGAVVFDPADAASLDGPTFFFDLIEPRDAYLYGHVDPNTMDWWRTQDPALRQMIFGGTRKAQEVYSNFVHFVEKYKPRHIWANSPQFDVTILRNLGQRLKAGPFPFSYRDERDLRTYKAASEVAGYGYPSGRAINLHAYPPHHPVGDALRQVLQVQSITASLLGCRSR